MRDSRPLVPLEIDRRSADGRPWVPVTTWVAIVAAGLATFALIGLGSVAPQRPISEVGTSGATAQVVRLAGALFMFVLTASRLLQAALLLPQRASRRDGATAPAVLDIIVIAAVVVETALVLAVGLDDQPFLNLGIVVTAGGIVLAAVVRFLLIAGTGIAELMDRRRSKSSRRQY